MGYRNSSRYSERPTAYSERRSLQSHRLRFACLLLYHVFTASNHPHGSFSHTSVTWGVRECVRPCTLHWRPASTRLQSSDSILINFHHHEHSETILSQSYILHPCFASPTLTRHAPRSGMYTPSTSTLSYQQVHIGVPL
jgi:hypothetical protein